MVLIEGLISCKQLINCGTNLFCYIVQYPVDPQTQQNKKEWTPPIRRNTNGIWYTILQVNWIDHFSLFYMNKIQYNMNL